jgi:hypothetical protein
VLSRRVVRKKLAEEEAVEARAGIMVVADIEARAGIMAVADIEEMTGIHQEMTGIYPARVKERDTQTMTGIHQETTGIARVKERREATDGVTQTTTGTQVMTITGTLIDQAGDTQDVAAIEDAVAMGIAEGPVVALDLTTITGTHLTMTGIHTLLHPMMIGTHTLPHPMTTGTLIHLRRDQAKERERREATDGVTQTTTFTHIHLYPMATTRVHHLVHPEERESLVVVQEKERARKSGVK